MLAGILMLVVPISLLMMINRKKVVRDIENSSDFIDWNVLNNSLNPVKPKKCISMSLTEIKAALSEYITENIENLSESIVESIVELEKITMTNNRRVIVYSVGSKRRCTFIPNNLSESTEIKRWVLSKV